jgi:hypothetical protein
MDGSWQLVRVVGWQHNGERWQCLLQWGVDGTVYGAGTCTTRTSWRR